MTGNPEMRWTNDDCSSESYCLREDTKSRLALIDVKKVKIFLSKKHCITYNTETREKLVGAVETHAIIYIKNGIFRRSPLLLVAFRLS